MNEEQLEEFLEAYSNFIYIPEKWDRISNIKNQETKFLGMNTTIKKIASELFKYQGNRVLDSYIDEIKKLDFSENSPLNKFYKEVIELNKSYDFENERFYPEKVASEKNQKEVIDLKTLENVEDSEIEKAKNGEAKDIIIESATNEEESNNIEVNNRLSSIENEEVENENDIELSVHINEAEDEIDRNLNVHIDEEDNERQELEYTATVKKSYSKEELKKFAEMIFNYGATVLDDTDTRMTAEQKDMYCDMFIYLMAGINEKGDFDSSVTYNFLDALSDYQVEQYTLLGKEIEKSKNNLKIDSNLSAEEQAKQEKMRDKFAKSIASYNTIHGYRTNNLSILFHHADSSAVARDLEEKLGVDANDSLLGVFTSMVTKKSREKMETLSEEEKRYFEMGCEYGGGNEAPGAKVYDDYPQEWKTYAEGRIAERDASVNEVIQKHGIENSLYKKYADTKQKTINFVNKFDDTLTDVRELAHIPSFGHISSAKFNEIIYACRAIKNMEINDEDKEGMQLGIPSGVRLIKTVEGKIDRLENALTNYLEDKWKPRKTPLGEKRFDKAFEILEKLNPAKARDMHEFHAMKADSKGRKTVDFEAYCQNKKAEKECLSFNDLLQAEGVAKDFVVVNKNNPSKTNERAKKELFI